MVAYLDSTAIQRHSYFKHGSYIKEGPTSSINSKYEKRAQKLNCLFNCEVQTELDEDMKDKCNFKICFIMIVRME